MIIVSACLLGIKCRYDGGSRPEKQLISVISEDVFIPLCPEQLGGLPTPRLPAWIVDGDGLDVLNGRSAIIDSNGQDVTEQFLRGAEEVRKLARLMQIDIAIMKEISPSCGVNHIKKDGLIIRGMGVTSALLLANGIRVISSDRIEEEYVRYHRNRK